MPSYSPVFSTSFIEYTADTPNTTFLVPEGFTAVVRDVTCYSQYGATYLQAYIAGAGATLGVIFASLNSVGVEEAAQWQGRIVAAAGYTIGIAVGSVSAYDSFYVGGYLLRNTLT